MLSSVRVGLFAAAVLGLLIPGAVARAHFAWLSSDEEGRVAFFFSEGPSERDYKLPEALAGTQVESIGSDGESSKVELQKVDTEEFVGLRSDSGAAERGVVATQCQYGIYHGTLLNYFAKHYLGSDASQWGKTKAKAGLALDVTPQLVDQGIQLSVTWKGEPLEGAEVTLVDPSGDRASHKTDPRGEVLFRAVSAGEVGFIIEHTDNQAKGEQRGQEYTSASYYLTLSLRHTPSEEAPSVAFESPYPSLPAPIASFGAAVADGYLYVYSGHTGEQHVHSKENLSQYFCRIAVEGGKEWEELPMQTPLQSTALVAYKDRVYRVGGMNARNAQEDEEDMHSVDEFACFDPAEKKWTSLAPLPEPRSSHDAVVVGNWLYVVGGWQLSGDSSGTWHDTAWKIDLDNLDQGWQKIADPPFRRRALAVSHWNNHVVAIGGMDEETRVSQGAFAFDIESGEWKPLPDLPGKGISGFGISAIHAGGALRASGMHGMLCTLSDDGKEWIIGTKMEDPRFFHRLAPGTEGNVLAVAGASTQRGHVADIEVIPLAGKPASTPTRPERPEAE